MKSTNGHHHHHGNNRSDDDDEEEEKYAKVRRRRRQEQKGRWWLLMTVAILAGVVVVVVVPWRWWTRIIYRVVDNNNNAVAMKKKRKQQLLVAAALERKYLEMDKEVRRIKATGVHMERDPDSLQYTRRFQNVVRQLIKARYGDIQQQRYRVRMDVQFQEPAHYRYKDDNNTLLLDKNQSATILVELAPIDLIPYSVFMFLELARGYQKGGFHRNAAHVLQAQVTTTTLHKPLAFQEYSEKYPHERFTTGFCGRPSDICWYISILNNTEDHGPGSQQDENPYEADVVFGRVIQGQKDVVSRIHRVMRQEDVFLENETEWVLVTAMHILVPDHGGGYREWHDSSSSSTAIQ